MIRKLRIVRVEVERLFHVTYENGETEIIRDKEISEKKVNLKQYLYLLEFAERKDSIKSLDDSNRTIVS